MNLQTIISILIFILVISLISIAGLLVLNRVSYPFKTCEGQEDNYTINFGKNMTCGEVRNITTGINSNQDSVGFFPLLLILMVGMFILGAVSTLFPSKKKLPNNDNKSI